MERYYKIIQKPLITEKTFDIIERENKSAPKKQDKKAEKKAKKAKKSSKK